MKRSHSTPFKPYQRVAYHKGVVLLMEAHQLLSGVRTVNWQQARLLNDVYTRIEEAVESLADISPNDLASEIRQTVKRWTD